MGLTTEERELYASLAWFEPAPALLGFDQMRPLSLASFKALQLMNIPLFLSHDAPPSRARERAWIAVYVALHTFDIATVSESLWDGSWCASAAAATKVKPRAVNQFRAYRERTLNAIEASLVTVRRRKMPEETPLDVVGPIDLAFKLALLTRGSSRSKVELQGLLWHTWLPQVLQLYHADLRWNGSWTVRAAPEPEPQDYGDTVPDFMKGQTFTAPDPEEK